jgi:beta-galactosidase
MMRISIVTVLALATVSTRAEPGPRLRENFNQGWLFQRQSAGSGELGSFDRDTTAASQIEPRFLGAIQPAYDDSSWEHITLPHTWNSQDTMDAVAGYWRGIGWYRKHFKLDPSSSGKRISLEFEGANLVSEFWLNGAYLGMHKSGYTSFELDLTAHVQFGNTENVLTVKVDNLYHAAIPPTVKTDYNFYGGIYRNTWLRINDPVYLHGVFWATPQVSEQAAVLRIQGQLTNATGTQRALSIVHQVLDPGGNIVATIERNVSIAPGSTVEFDHSTNVQQPRLWSPETPDLYTIRSSLRERDRTIDAIQMPLGFRWFRFDPQAGFFLNGKRVPIRGVNRHQSYPGLGNALPDSRQWKDMQLIRAMGVNFWRTSHYPPAPAAIEASDKLGLLVWEELPVNKEIGNPEEYIANVRQMAREMIARDRNNPSVIVWGISGEVNASARIAQQVVAAVANQYRELDPTRPVAMHEPRGEAMEALVDLIGLGVGKETDEKHRRFPQRAYMTAEYSAALPGRGLYDGGPNSEEVACEQHEDYLRQLNRRPWMAGGTIWNAIDYDGESYDPVTPHIVSFGMADIWRIPKDVYYFYQSQWSAQPMLHIVGHWTWPGQEGRSRTVKVYSNAPQVELFLNGRSVGIKEDLAGAGDLLHPPRVWNVEYQPGTLEAVAQFGIERITEIRKTAGPASQIVLESDTRELRSGDRESLAYITTVVADRDGTPVPDSAAPIAFTWYGPGELLPQTWPGHATGLTWNAVAGMTRIAFRATSRTGQAVISASSPGLKMGRTTVLLAAPGKPNEMDYQERFEEDEIPVTANRNLYFQQPDRRSGAE